MAGEQQVRPLASCSENPEADFGITSSESRQNMTFGLPVARRESNAYQ